MSHIFISYSRKNLNFAEKIVEVLADNNLDTWVDWKSIPKGEDWEQEIYRGIEEADAFLFLISPHSVQSEMCNKEVAHSIKNNKRILPVFIANVSNKEVYDVTEKFLYLEQKEEINRRNFIFCREDQDDFEKAMEEIRATIHTDYEWLKYHTKLQVKALDWERGKDNSQLLRGKELKEADNILSKRVTKEPQPTEIQLQYILTSRRSEERQRRLVTIVLSLVLVLMVGLSAIAWVQRNNAKNSEATAVAEANSRATAESNAIKEANARATAQAIAESNEAEAKRQAIISRAGELAALSVSSRAKNLDISLLLSVEAFKTIDNLQTRGTLLDGTQSNPYLVQYINTEHHTYIGAVAFSPNGEILATAGGSDTTNSGAMIILRDAKTHKKINKLLTSSGTSILHCIAFSPDGKTIAAGDDDGTVYVWDLQTLQLLEPNMTGHTEAVKSVAFSPNGNIIASGGYDGSINLWDVRTHLLVKRLKNHYLVSSIAFSPDGKVIASSDLSEVILWNMETYEPMDPPLKGYVGNVINSVAFSSDGNTLAVAGRDIVLWNIPLARSQISVNLYSIDSVTKTLTTNSTEAITTIAFSPVNNTLLAGSQDGTINLWSNIWDYNPIRQEFTTGIGSINSLSFSNDGNAFASSSLFSTITLLWNLESTQPISQKISTVNEAQGAGSTSWDPMSAFSLDGKIQATASSDGTITLWDSNTHQQIGQLVANQPGGGINMIFGFNNCLTFSPDGKMLASCSSYEVSSQNTSGNGYRGVVTLWDVASQQLIKNLTNGNIGDVNKVAFSPDGKILASITYPFQDMVSDTVGNDYYKIIIWDTETGQQIGQPLAPSTHSQIDDIAFNSEGTLLVWINNSLTAWGMSPMFWIEVSCQRAGRNFTQTEWSRYFPNEPYRKTCPQWSAGE